MPRYFFELINNNEVIGDPEGEILGNLTAAHEEAVQTLVEMAAELIPTDGARDMAIVVKDDGGKLVLRVHLSFDPGPRPN